MSVLAWISGKTGKIEQEKKDLKVELTQAMMKFERHRGEVEQVANDVMRLMHDRSNKK